MLLSLPFQLARGHVRGAERDVRAENYVSRPLPAWQALRHAPQSWPTEGPSESFGCVARVGERALPRLVFVGFKPAGEVEAQLAQPPAQRLARDPQPACGLLLIAAGRL